MTGNSDTREAFRTCPLCEATCGLKITLSGDRVVRIVGDREDVFSRGFYCPKGAALGALHDDPDRLRRPLVRRGASFVEVSWADAFAEVDQGLVPIMERHGRDAVAVFSGNPCAHTLSGSLYMRPLVRALKTRNIFTASTTDQMPRHVSAGLMYGAAGLMPVPDLDRTHYLVMMGANPLVSGGSLCTAPGFSTRLKAIKDRGGKVVVLDPAETRTARAASEHHRIRPGTDPWLLLAMARTLFDEGLVSLGRLADFTAGLEVIEETVRRFSPERAADRCGIPSETIRRLAREAAAAPSAAFYGRIGVHAAPFGTLNAWLADLLCVLTGNLDRPGGLMFPRPGHIGRPSGPSGRAWQPGRWHSRVKGLPEVIGEFPVATMADEIETPGGGQVRALVTVAGNPVASAPNAARLDRALSGLDFTVSVDFYLNETTRHAKVILPPPGPLAASHYDVALYNTAVRNVANYSPPVLPRNDDHPDKWEIMLKLALIASGQGPDADPQALDDFIITQAVQAAVAEPGGPLAGRDPGEILDALAGRRGPERQIDLMFRNGLYGDGFGRNPDGLSLDKLEAHPHGLDLGPMKPVLPELLRTTSGRIQLAPQWIMNDLPRLEAGALLDTLVLVGRRHIRSCNSWMHNIQTLIQGPERCTLLVHPEDAARLGLSAGGRARISSRVGVVEAPVEIGEELMPGVVSLPHGWGHDAPGLRMSVAGDRPGVNSNILTDESVDPLSGNAVLNGIPVTVEAVG
ncbi:MAG: molybdopterin-dependent oxidoreductase [Proteobacteria bacterium]|nr:molybdopterin-dependent oxidoreductase [Pseudomonadota bacterium]